MYLIHIQTLSSNYYYSNKLGIKLHKQQRQDTPSATKQDSKLFRRNLPLVVEFSVTSASRFLLLQAETCLVMA